jgi:hypothetical protein
MSTGAGSQRKETVVSVVRPLPDRPNLTNLRKQAKALLAAWRAGDQQALIRVRDLHPRGARLTETRRHSLADAQLVVARGYGFASWTRLVQHLRLAPNAQALYTIDRLFQATLAPAGQPTTVGQVLDRRVEVVWQAHLVGRPEAVIRAAGLIATGNLLRDPSAVPGIDEADHDGPTIDDVRDVIAREHGFADWAAAATCRSQPVDAHFEAAVDAIVSGDPETLRALLDTDPALVQAHSPFGRHATLLHYVAANGVESSRQWQSPRNAVQILQILLRQGADPDAVCDAYGGGLTPLCALVSSAHPAIAGVQGGLVEELCQGGANPNGLDEDGLPLWTAITYGYPAAVDALARSGARVDNVVFAAAAGDVPRVRNYLQDGGRPGDERPVSARRVGSGGPALDPDHLVEYALIYSAGLGRQAVVELLLAEGPDLSVIEPVWRSTAAGAARYHHRHQILALLEAT